jgi:hypothetical protein
MAESKKDKYLAEYDKNVKTPTIFDTGAEYKEFSVPTFEEAKGEEEKGIKKDQAVAQIIEGLSNIAGSILSYKLGVASSAIKTDNTDWEKRLDRLRDDYSRQVDIAYKKNLLNNEQVDKLRKYQADRLGYASQAEGEELKGIATEKSNRQQQAYENARLAESRRATDLDAEYKNKSLASDETLKREQMLNDLKLQESRNEGALANTGLKTDTQKDISKSTLNTKIQLAASNIELEKDKLKSLEVRVKEANELKKTMSDAELKNHILLQENELEQKKKIHNDKIMQIRADRSLDEFEIKERVRLAEAQMAQDVEMLDDKLDAMKSVAGMGNKLGSKKEVAKVNIDKYRAESLGLQERRIEDNNRKFETGKGLDLTSKMGSIYRSKDRNPEQLYNSGAAAIEDLGKILGMTEAEMDPFRERYDSFSTKKSSWFSGDSTDKTKIYKEITDIMAKMQKPEIKDPLSEDTTKEEGQRTKSKPKTDNSLKSLPSGASYVKVDGKWVKK